MRTVELGRTGEQVSQLALGCMIMGTSTSEEDSFTMLDRYLEAGGGFLDTANCYAWWLRRDSLGGESESLLGRWLERGPASRRDQVFLATKGSAMVPDLTGVWGEGDEPDTARGWRNGFDGAGAGTLRRSIDDSLRRLRTDHVDLYYVHVDDHATPLEETLEALAGIVRAGKARHIGWSNVHTWRLERIRQLCDRHGWPAPVAVQQQHSYLRRRPGLEHASIVDDEQLHYLRAHDDLTLVAYSPLLKGVYESAARRAEHGVLDAYRGADSEARLTALAEVAAETGLTPSQVVLAWLLHQNDPGFVTLIGTRTLEQFATALGAVDAKLSAEQLERLATAGA